LGCQGDFGLTMLEFNSRVDKIATDLQEQIKRGKLKPGERLPSERSLCSLFGVGRTTIREALNARQLPRIAPYLLIASIAYWLHVG